MNLQTTVILLLILILLIYAPLITFAVVLFIQFKNAFKSYLSKRNETP